MEFIPHATKLKMMELPRIIIIGPKALDEIKATYERLRLPKSTLIICDKTTRRIAGNSVASKLKKAGYDVHISMISDVSSATLERVQKEVKAARAGSTIGIGGGRPIDIAKYTASKASIPFISIPTATSHDGIASGRATLWLGRAKSSIETQPPAAIIADTVIIASSPFRLTQAGCGDILANYSAVADWRLAHRLKGEDYSNYSAVLAEQSALMLMENIEHVRPHLEESARILLKALVTSGIAMSIAGSSRPASGSEHMFSHALDQIAKRPALHGEQCGVGAIMMSYLHGLDWERVRATLKAIKAPVTARQLGVTKAELIKALTTAHRIRPERYTILGAGLDEETAVEAAQTAGVI
jgi:glycerol-1-phosphate dehydrogenase [NAD(P)+]